MKHKYWALFYILLISGSALASVYFYDRYDNAVSPEGNIEFEISQEKYYPEETVGFSIKNNFPVTVYVLNQCPKEPLDVYRWENEKWVAVHDVTDSEKCNLQERDIGIEPGATRNYDFSEWPGLFSKPGVYRLAVSINHSEDAIFRDFAVVMHPEIVTILLPGKTTAEPAIAEETIPEEETNTYSESDYYETEHDEEEDEEEDGEDRYEREEEED